VPSKYLQTIFSSLMHVYPLIAGPVSCFKNWIFSLDIKPSRQYIVSQSGRTHSLLPTSDVAFIIPMFVAGRHFKMTSDSAWVHARCSYRIIQVTKNRHNTGEILYRFLSFVYSYTRVTDARQHPPSQILCFICTTQLGLVFRWLLTIIMI
jgi:hypothetical protein